MPPFIVIEKFFAWIFVLIMFISLSIIGKWMFVDKSPSVVTYIHEKLLINPIDEKKEITPLLETSFVFRGITYYRYVEYCTSGGIKGKVITYYVDGITYDATPHDTISTPGCFKRSVAVKIPQTLPPGEYRLITFVRYVLNPLKTIDTKKQEIDIVVVK